MNTIKKAAIATGVVSGTAAGLCGLVFHEVFNRDAKLFKLVGDKVTASKLGEAVEIDPREEWFCRQKFESIGITDDFGNALRGYYLPADEPSDKFVFLSHGYRSSGKSEYALMAKFYHEKKFNILMVDHPAHGDSDGKYIGFGYYESRAGIKWLRYLIDRFGSDIRIMLQGISLGCATVTMMTGSPDLPENVKMTVADCGYTTAKEQFKAVLGSAHIPGFPLINGVEIFNRKFSGFKFDEVSPIECVARAKIPMVFIHGACDDFVPTAMCSQLYNACSAPEKEMLIIDGAWHAQSYKTDSASYEALVTKFMEKYIP